MSGTTSVPAPSFTDKGFVPPAEPDILAGVLADFNAAFGGRLNPALETPQGQLASSFSAVVGDKDAQFAALANGVDPAFASGRMQDGIARIYFLTRQPAEPTSVQVRCTGLVNAPVPAGALLEAQDGTIYACTEGGTIGAGGTVTLPFAATTTGPIACPAGTLNTIYQSVPGLDRVTNDADGVVGNDIESRAAFEQRRAASVAINANGSLSTIQANVLNVPNVLDAYSTENDTGSPITSDGVTIPAHSLYVCVAGGDPQAVARAIWSKKAPGCGYAGNHTEVVADNNAGYALPVPTYNVSFQIAAPQTFVVMVTLSNNAGIPGTATTIIQQAVLNAFSGADGGSRARIGSDVYASRFYAGVASLGTWAEIVSIKLGSTRSPDATFTASIAGTVLTVTAVASGTIASNQTVVGANIPDGVVITSVGTGSGGTGTYNINLAQTVASQTMQTAFADLDVVTIGVAHVPVLGGPNVRVTLV